MEDSVQKGDKWHVAWLVLSFEWLIWIVIWGGVLKEQKDDPYGGIWNRIAL